MVQLSEETTKAEIRWSKEKKRAYLAAFGIYELYTFNLVPILLIK